MWWREDGSRHTLVTIAGPIFGSAIGASSVGLTFALHDVDGTFVRSWRQDLRADETLFVDSRTTGAPVAADFSEGALVIWVTPTSAPPTFARDYSRAGTMVDWYSDAGDLASLHADQSVTSPSRPLELTEMVFVETPTDRTLLVIVNGPEQQPACALRLVLQNVRGERRAFDYPHAMAPFSVNKIALGELTPDLVGFCGGAEATVAGTFEAHGIFTRPYVVTEGEKFSAYHGGDRYSMASIPRLVHRTFPFAEAHGSVPTPLMRVTGQKELNPGYAIHGASLTTRVHLFQSHGELQENFFVDASLYDTTGRLVAHRERWAVAPREGATTCEIAELTGGAEFEGHVALRFSDDATKAAFPRRLQALMEYRTAVSVARTMLWSDRWNAPDRVREQLTYRALFRVFARGPRMSKLAITNPGVSSDYDRVAPYVVRLRSARGEELVHRGELAAHATTVASIDELFPSRFEDELALAIVESPFDLASMHLTIDARSGVVAAEHLLAVFERVGETLFAPCGW